MRWSALDIGLPYSASIRKAMRASERLRRAAEHLAAAAQMPPTAVNALELAKISSRLLAVASQVELDERSIVVCPNCEADLPEGCGGMFKSDGDSCWLNRVTR